MASQGQTLPRQRHRGRFAGLAVVLSALLIMSGCGLGTAATDGSDAIGGELEVSGIGLHPTGPGYEPELDAAIVAVQRRFGLAIYRELAGQGGEGSNVFISPASIALALALAYNGAQGETAAAMAEALGFGDLSLEQVNDSYYALIKSLAGVKAADESVTLNIANGLWQDQGIEFKQDFLDRSEQYYGAAVEALDFTDPGSAGVINQWVSEQTNGRIPELITQIPADAVLYIINAIYFKADWSKPFDADHTAPAPFHLADASTADVPLMRQDGTFDYYRGDGFQAIRLPYGETERLAMYVFLPDSASDLTSFQQLLTADNWQHWMASFDSKYGRIAIPRFQLRNRFSLNRALIDMGMEVAFDPDAADFGGMREVRPGNNLYISDVVHETFLEVNETGSEAAGATSVEVSITSLPVAEFELTVDRPFFVAVQDEETGALLFAGSVADPTAN